MAKSRTGLVMIMILLGVLFAVSGLVFMLQGSGMVGPNSSFMFRNQAWIYDGLFILVGGLILIGVGYFFRPKSKQVTTVATPGEEKS